MTPGRAAALWTGGKDCALALLESRRAGLDISELVTFAPPSPRFLAHPLPFMARQAEALGLPHRVMTVAGDAREGYAAAVAALRREGFTTLVTGDIAEVEGRPNWMRAVCRGTGVEVATPLWGRKRDELLARLLDSGVEAVFSLVKRPWFTRAWVGRPIDARAVADLTALEPAPDPCGENGEYHSLVLAAPGFRRPLRLGPFSVAESGDMMYLELPSRAESHGRL